MIAENLEHYQDTGVYVVHWLQPNNNIIAHRGKGYEHTAVKIQH